MEEQMGRRTVGGLILTRAGSILVFRDEKEPSRKSKPSPEPSRRNPTTTSIGEGSSSRNNNKKKKDQNENLASKINRSVSSISRTYSQIQGSLRGKNENSSENRDVKKKNTSGPMRKRRDDREEGEKRVSCGNTRCGQVRGEGFRGKSLAANERRNGVGISRFCEGPSVNLSGTSSEEDAGYWHFNLDDSSERFLDQESNSFLDDRSWPDRHREMRMDIDDMSYEDLLAFCERIGTVNTGLPEATLSECIKRSFYVNNSSNNNMLDKEEGDIKCIICQEEYNIGEEIGNLACEHYYHNNCIDQWLRLKNWCPICKTLVSSSP